VELRTPFWFFKNINLHGWLAAMEYMEKQTLKALEYMEE
jgi:hypothetical protein